MFSLKATGGARLSIKHLFRAWFRFNLDEFLHPLNAGNDLPAADVPVSYVAVPGTSDEVVPVLPPAQDGDPDPLTTHILYVTGKRDQERQAIEDTRANRRNRNRMLTLLGALVIGLGVTYILNAGYLGTFGPVLAPYAFTITIAMDSTLAAYSWLRHY